jgi:V8-like Glu-specific endopeptidase
MSLIRLHNVRLLVAAAGLAILPAFAAAQPVEDPTDNAPIKSFDTAVNADSGLLQAGPGPIDNVGQVSAVFELSSPGSPWIRVNFGAATILAGDPAADNASFIRITSVEDGSVQTLNAEHLRFWANKTAYFNGDTVVVELVTFPGTSASRVVIDSVTGGVVGIGSRSICGVTDDRTLSSDPRTGRLMSVGCTAWLFNDLNKTFLTAGHCGPSSGNVVQFNVPLSSTGGATINPGAADQYTVDTASIKITSGVSLGNDWSYFATTINSQTGLTPAQVQAQWFTLSTAAPSVGATNRITGYGTTSAPVSNTWNQVQKTHVGTFAARSGNVLYYNADTTGGNSGSAVINDSLGGVSVGIHTNAGCTTSGGNNSGTWAANASFQAALSSPIGLLKTGNGTPVSGLYAMGDGANNFGTLNRTTGNFAKISTPPFMCQGLTWDWAGRDFYAVSSAPTGTANRRLYSVDLSGNSTLIGSITGTNLIVNGLAYDPIARVLFGWIQSSGQLVTINTSNAAVTLVGSANAGTNIGGLEFDQVNQVLYGVDDRGTGSVLVTINPATGAITTIGALGSGIVDCNGLAYSSENAALYTIDASTEGLLRINPATGLATVVGSTGGVFGASSGLAFATKCPGDINSDGTSEFADFLDFFNAFDTEGSAADVDYSGTVDFGDFLLFFNFYDQGC